VSRNLEHPTVSVLLIDGNTTDRGLYADGLKRCSSDYLILEASDGQTARQIYGCVRVDCVVLELELPDRSGLKLLLDLVPIASKSNIAVIVLTLIEDPNVQALATQSGAHAWLEKKHTSPEDLHRAIQRALARAA
jgi:CheY-like chemotaxis protein